MRINVVPTSKNDLGLDDKRSVSKTLVVCPNSKSDLIKDEMEDSEHISICHDKLYTFFITSIIGLTQRLMILFIFSFQLLPIMPWHVLHVTLKHVEITCHGLLKKMHLSLQRGTPFRSTCCSITPSPLMWVAEARRGTNQCNPLAASTKYVPLQWLMQIKKDRKKSLLGLGEKIKKKSRSVQGRGPCYFV